MVRKLKGDPGDFLAGKSQCREYKEQGREWQDKEENYPVQMSTTEGKGQLMEDRFARVVRRKSVIGI